MSPNAKHSASGILLRISTFIRVGLILAALALVVIAVAVRAYMVAPKLVDVEASIKALWDGSGDRPVTIEGTPSFALFPPAFVLSNSQIRTERGVTLSAGRIDFGFHMSSLLTGAYHIASITIDGGKIRVPQSAPMPDTRSAENFLIGFVTYFDRTQNRNQSDFVESIFFKNTQINFDALGDELQFQSPMSELHRGIDGSLVLTSKITLNSQLALVSFEVGSHSTSLARGRETKFSIRTDSTEISGEGATAFDSNLQFLGRVMFSTKNLQSFGAWIGQRLTSLPEATAKLSANARLSFSAMTLSDMQLKIGSSDISGNVIADFAPTPARLTGTLAASTLDLTDLVTRIGVKRDTFGNWSAEPIPNHVIPDLSMDLRLSSDKVLIDEVVMRAVALSALIRDQKAELSLASGNLFDGSISGKIRLTGQMTEPRYLLESSLAFENIDVEKAGIALLDSKRTTGMTTGRLTLLAEGASSADMIHALQGDVNITTENNSVDGLDLLAFLHRVEARPLGAVLALKNGKTLFDHGQFDIKIKNGVGSLQKAKLTKYPDLQVRLAGDIDLANRKFAITGHALGSSAQASDRSIDLPFSLQGPFDDPAFVPDFTNVTKQSGAIAP